MSSITELPDQGPIGTGRNVTQAFLGEGWDMAGGGRLRGPGCGSQDAGHCDGSRKHRERRIRGYKLGHGSVRLVGQVGLEPTTGGL